MERVQRSAEAVARRAFAAGVSSLPGPKILFVEAALYDARTSSALCVRAFADPPFLSEHGVRDIVPLPSPRAEALLRAPEPRAAIFLLRGASARGARNIVKAIRLRAPDAPPLRCVVLVTPRLSTTVQRVFDGAGVTAALPTAALPLGFLPYDADVLTLDWPAAYKELVLNGDASAILAAASGLTAIADALRLRFAPIRSAGPAAAAVAEQLLETHGRRYSRPRGVAGNRPPGSLQTSPASPAPSAAPVRNAFLPRAFALLTPTVAGDTDDDAGSAYGSEYYAFSDTDTLSQSVGGQSHGAVPTLGDLNEARQPRTDVPLVLIDRGVDIASALLSQWTYEGLLDESLGLGNNQLVVPVSELRTEDAAGVLKPTSADSGMMTMQLRADSDNLFAQVRDLSYWAAARQIGEVASGVKEYYSARPERGVAEIAAVKSYVAGLREKTSAHRRAAEHVALAAEISRRTFECAPFKRRFEFERELLEGGSATVRRVFVAEMIARGESLPHVLRIACLWSVTSSGVDSEFFDAVRREIAAAFGLKTLPLLANLERAGLFARAKRSQSAAGWLGFPALGGGGDSPPRQEDVDDTASVASFQSARTGASFRSSRTSASSVRPRAGHSPTLAPRASGATHSWQFARAALRLVTTFDPDDEPAGADRPGAPYLGYTPLSVRLIEAALSPDGWARLPPCGPNTALLPVGHAAVEHRAAGPPVTEKKGAVPFDAVVVFVGGVTRAEASATRIAAGIAGKRCLILATHVIGADEFVESFAEEGFFA